jgi:hypothetical protein
MKVPTNSIAHRDCCIGVSFPLVALEKYPDWKKKPARLIEAQKILTELQSLLEVSRFSAGEKRSLQTTCEAAADAIDDYDATHRSTRDQAYAAWCVMWFLGDEAFADALFYGGSWKKRPELWVKAKHLIGKTSDRLYPYHVAEAEEAARIWHCHASPRKNPGLEGIWKK